MEERIMLHFWKCLGGILTMRFYAEGGVESQGLVCKIPFREVSSILSVFLGSNEESLQRE